MQNEPVHSKFVPVQRGTQALGRLHTHPPPDLTDVFRYSRLFTGLDPFRPDEALLVELGRKGGILEDPDGGKAGDARTRAAGITFLGQFINHDITFDRHSSITETNDPAEVRNFRNPTLGLDSLYGLGPAHNPQLYDPQDPALLRIGRNDQGLPNDLPRGADGKAIIGDERNDESIITSQLHLAFLKFHNAVVAHVRREKQVPPAEVFARAQQLVRWHYQWVVLHDFLPQVVDKAVVDDVLTNGRKCYQPVGRPTVPIEFSLAAFRFGHSMVKPTYVLNDVTGGRLFHELLGGRPIPEKEVIQWHFFFWLDPAQPTQHGRRIDTRIARPLFELPEGMIPHATHRSLSTLSLLRGARFGLPSGEALAHEMKKVVPGIQPLTADQLGLQPLGFTASPLWYYILKEAERQGDGERLGDVGGRIVAEVIAGLLDADGGSFRYAGKGEGRDWTPVLPSAVPGTFTIEDLLRFAGVADHKADQAADPDSRKRRKCLARYRRKFKGYAPADPVRVGRWDILGYDSQIEAVHMSLMPNGKVLYYSGFRVAEAVKTETRLWDPKDGGIRTPNTPSDMFCGGHCLLPDGNVLSTGGTMEYRNLPPVPPKVVRAIRPLSPLIVRLFGKTQKYPITFSGPTYLYVFDRKQEQWTFVGDMEGGRWYPTNTLLPDGRVLILSGTDEAGGFSRSNVYAAINRRVEVYDTIRGLQYVSDIPDFEVPIRRDLADQLAAAEYAHAHPDDKKTLWQRITGLIGRRNDDHAGDGHDHGDGVFTSEGPEDQRFPSVYPRMFVLPVPASLRGKYPQGRAFCAGYGPETKMLNLNNWTWEDVGELEFRIRRDGCAVLLPLKPPYDRARVLHFAGSLLNGLKATATNTAELIDFGEEKPKWRAIPASRQKRVNGVAVTLPDGTILAVGGNSTGRFDDPVHRSELFDPETLTWYNAAQQTIPRGYHSTALLLPDGRVLSSGTTPLGKHELGMEVYYPAYLFRGPRPVIVEVNPETAYGGSFAVRYEYSWEIKRVVLVAPGSVTHAFDMHARHVELAFAPDGPKRLRVTAPPDAHVAPPGYYMLFLLSERGVPSEAAFVQMQKA